MPIQVPKNHVLGEFWPPNIIFYHRNPQKALPYAETRVLSHKRSWSVFWCDLKARARIQKKDRWNTKSNGKFPPYADPLSVVPHQPNSDCGAYPRYLSWFQVSLTSVEKCGSCGGRNYVVNAYHLKKTGRNPPKGFAPHIGEIYTRPIWNLLHFFGPWTCLQASPLDGFYA